MLGQWMTIVVGLVGGVAVGAQAPLAGAMGARVGALASSVIVHGGGLLASCLLLVAVGGERIAQWRGLHPVMLGSGIFGVVLYLTLTQTVARLGASAALTLLIVGQLLTGMLLEHFGLFGLASRAIDAQRALAAALLIAGAYWMVR